MQSGFESFNLQNIPRNGNTHVDSLAILATSLAQSLPWVILVENLCKPTKMKSKMVHIHQIRVGPSWIDSIVVFIKKDILLEEKLEVDKVWRKAPWFWLFEDQSYTSTPFPNHIYSAYTMRQQSYS